MKALLYQTLLMLLGSAVLLGQNFDIEINENLQANTLLLIEDFENIEKDRKSELEELGSFMLNHMSKDQKFSILFVCTHNSRRSHITDLWFKYATTYYGVNQFESFSGGTEATAFNTNAIEAISRVGFTTEYNKKTKNPVVSITPGHYPVWQMKSKVYNDKVNPKSSFVAVMVCSDADKSCPLVEGSAGRFAIPYNDPRYYDNTPAQEQKYDETVTTIGTEMLYLVHFIKTKMILEAEAKK